MAKSHAGTELDQPCGRCRAQRIGADAESLGRAPEQGDVTGGLGRRDEQQLPRVAWKRLDAPPEAPLDPARQQGAVGQSEPSRQLARRQAARQLQQRERVAPRLGQNPVADPRVQWPADSRRQHRARVVVAEPVDEELRQAGELVRVAWLADGEHHGDPLGQQSPRDERQCLPGGSVEPLRIVDHARERTLLGRVGQQAQDRERDQEAIRRPALLEPERLPQRRALRARKVAQPVEHRAAELMQARERQLHLGLHAGGANDAPARCLLHDVLQQRGLADPRLAAQDQHFALTRPHALQQHRGSPLPPRRPY